MEMICATADLLRMDKEEPKKQPFDKFIGMNKCKPTILRKVFVDTTDNSETKKYHYKIIIVTPIEAPDQMVEVVDLLRNCNSEDFVEIILSTPGGEIPTMLDLLAAMDECKATIKTVISGMAASCGYIIWTYGDILECRKNSFAMAHSSSQGICGKTLDIQDYSTHMIAVIEQLFQRGLTKGILTQEEYNKIMTDRCDVYLSEEILTPRIEAYNNPKEPEEGTIPKEDIIQQSVLPNKKEEDHDDHTMVGRI